MMILRKITLFLVNQPFIIVHIQNCYMIIDMGTSEIMDTFVSFNDMLEAFLTDAVK